MTIPVETKLEPEPTLEEMMALTPVNYAIVIPCRNEEKLISDCLDAALNQSIPPSVILVVDDSSTDFTPNILEKWSIQDPRVVPIRINYKRYKNRGYNVSGATRKAYEELFKMELNFDYIMNLDSDTIIPYNYVETLIGEMERNPSLAICSGIADWRKQPIISNNHATNAARLYRASFSKEEMPYPIINAHDTYMEYRAIYMGWEVKTLPLIFKDQRRFKRSLIRWFLSGQFRYRNGLTIRHAFLSALQSLRQTPYIVGSLVGLFSFLVHCLTDSRLKDRDYIEHMQKFNDRDIIDYFKGRFRRMFFGHIK